MGSVGMAEMPARGSGQSLSWSRSQKSGQVHSADSAVQGAFAGDVADREASWIWGVSSISIFGS
jgi:hypothetical protein